jgi:hypothetical protein
MYMSIHGFAYEQSIYVMLQDATTCITGLQTTLFTSSTIYNKQLNAENRDRGLLTTFWVTEQYTLWERSLILEEAILKRQIR